MYFKIKKFQLIEQIYVFRNYYKNIRYALIDIILGFLVFFINPYRTCRKFLEKRGASSIHGYGEIPLREFEKLLKEANITAADRYLELGFGRGKTTFWTALFIRCSVRGVEWVPTFVKSAKMIAKIFDLPMDLQQKSIRETSLSDATVIYHYTMLSEKILPLASIQKGARLITISEKAPDQLFICQKQISIQLPWGTTWGYIHVRK